MFLTKFKSFILIALVISLFMVGCASQQARRIDPRGTETITTVGGLDIQDAADAASELSQSLLASGVLGRNGKPSIIAIDRYINNTSQQIDRDIIIKKIRVTLNKAGVAQTTTALNSSGGIGGESQIASSQVKKQHQNLQVDAFLGNDKNVNIPTAAEMTGVTHTLTFKILDNRVRSGRIRQTTYIFQMSLTDIKTGLAVWEDEKQITKQGRKAAVGW